MGHTPGPWGLHKWGGDFTGDDDIDVLASGDLEVCTLRHNEDHNGQPDRLNETMIADARLIASAPEMLACLRAALAAFQELDDDWRCMDATLVDQIIATNRYAIGGCLLRAEGTDEQPGPMD